MRYSRYTAGPLNGTPVLDLMINAGHKDVLQYVAPRDFEQLRAPLLEADTQPHPL